MIFFTKAKLVA